MTRDTITKLKSLCRVCIASTFNMIRVSRYSTPKLMLLFLTVCCIYVAYYHLIYSKESDAVRNERVIFMEGAINSNDNKFLCKQPVLPVDSPEMMRFVKNVPNFSCESDTNPDWVSCEGSECVVKKSIKKGMDKVKCKFTDILRVDDHTVQHSKSGTITNEKFTLSNSDVVKIQCASLQREWTSIKMAVRFSPAIFQRTGWEYVPSDGLKMNVLMFGLDSVSRNTFIRKLPHSYHYLVNILGAHVLQGYNIVGDGTPQALTPILTGQTELELPDVRKRYSNTDYVDVYPLIWKEYSKNGYVTAFFEDMPSTGIYTYRLNGFKEDFNIGLPGIENAIDVPTPHFWKISKFFTYLGFKVTHEKIAMKGTNNFPWQFYGFEKASYNRCEMSAINDISAISGVVTNTSRITWLHPGCFITQIKYPSTISSLKLWPLINSQDITQPTDHYMRPYYLASEVYHSKWKKLCDGEVPRHKVMLKQILNVFSVYQEKPKFLFGFHGELSHDDYNLVGIADDDIVEFLTELNNSNALNNTILIIMADHGHRFADIRDTLQGKLEERLPFFSFRFPQWFKNVQKELYENFVSNINTLTTPFDIHATLSDILHKRSPKIGDLHNRSLSLFSNIPHTRTCADAYIEPHWCACLDWDDLNVMDPVVIHLSQAFLDTVNNYTSAHRDICAKLAITNIINVTKLKPKDKLLKFKQTSDKDGFMPNLSGSTQILTKMYQIKVQTTPGNGIFEASITYSVGTDKYNLKLSDISRINMYGRQARCIENTYPYLRKYCYCTTD